MLFFKPKQKPDDVMPPPPPPELEGTADDSYDPQFTEKPKFFDEIVKPANTQHIPEADEFDDIVNSEILSQKTQKANTTTKIFKSSSKPKFAEVKKGSKIKNKLIKESKGRQSKAAPSEFEFDIDDELDTLSYDDSSLRQGANISGLEEFGADNLINDRSQSPKEVIEAHKEIQDAIKNISSPKKSGFFSGLFSKNKQEKIELGVKMQPDGISAIQGNIKKARDSLMTMDLEATRKIYVGIMKDYNKLDPKDKSKVYNEINDLYADRKSAEALKA